MYFLIVSLLLSLAQAQIPLNCKTSFVGTPMDLQGVAKKIKFDEETKTTWVVGNFSKIAGTDRTNIAGLDQRMNILPANPRMNGVVNDVLQVGNQLIIAGEFDRVGNFKDVGSILKLNADGSIDKSFPRFKGKVDKLLPDGKGGIYVSGLLRKYGDTTSTDYDWFRHFDKNGVQLPVSYEMSKLQYHQEMLIHKGRLYYLSSFNGLKIFDLKSERLLASFAQENIFYAMKDIAIYNDALVIAGGFNKIGDTEAHGVAILGEDFKVTPLNFPHSDFSSDINKVLVVGDKIYYINRADLFFYDLKTNQTINTSTRATHMSLFQGKLYLLDMYQKNMEVNVIEVATGAMTKLPLPFSGQVEFMHVTDLGITISGKLLSSDGNMHFNITFNSATGLQMEPNGNISSIAKDGDNSWVGGEFSVIDGQTIKGLALYDLTTSTYHQILTNDFQAKAEGLVKIGDDVYASGYFADKIYYSNGVVKIDVQRQEGISSVMGSIVSQAVSGDKLYLAGDFNYGDKNWCVFGYMDTKTSALKCLVPKKEYPAPNQYMRTISLGKDKVYFEGQFSGMLGADLKNLMVFDLKTNLPASWQADLTAAWVASANIIEFEGVTYIGGVFNNVRGEDHNFFTAIDSNSGNFINWPLKMTASYAMGLRKDTLMMNVYKDSNLTSLIQAKTCNH